MNFTKKTVILPIYMNNIDCVTSCWIYNRLAIIKTSPYYSDWVASHYNLFADSDFVFSFGETTKIPASYHDEILERKPLHLFQFSENNIIENLKAEIMAGYYIVMHVMQNTNPSYFHEVLFYGFDDASDNMIGISTGNPIKYSYSHIRNTLSSVKRRLIDNIQESILLSIHYQYPATAFKVNNNFTPQNCPYEAFSKLKEELEGGFHNIHQANVYGEYNVSDVVYRGINCLYRFEQLLKLEITENAFLNKYSLMTRAAKKLQEHRSMMLHSMKYLSQKWKAAMTTSSAACILEYERCCVTSQKWLALILKYTQTMDKQLLEKVVTEIPDAFEQEKRILEKFLFASIKWDVFNEKYI